VTFDGWAEKDRLRPGLGDILKWASNALLRNQNSITFVARGKSTKMSRSDAQDLDVTPNSDVHVTYEMALKYSMNGINWCKAAAARLDDGSGIQAQILPVKPGDDLNGLRQAVHK
jgi:hypothetical protein